ncbi:MAG: lycopene cyclase domain-containing protein [Polyangiaceae bacterium]|nr:lycopene cyclase domain-containing protein [Polyangiaceae bacterium]
MLTTLFLWKSQKRTFKRMLLATSLVAVPFWIWDSLVTHRHWWFNPLYTSGIDFLSLPLGEWLFFLTVPYASILLWVGFKGFRYPALQGFRLLWVLLVCTFGALAIFSLSQGWEYTCLAASAMALFALADRVFGTALWARPSFWIFSLGTFVLTAIFNHYLVTRPVVLYGEAYKSGIFVNAIPIEDYFYGLALIGFGLMIFTLLEGENKERSLFGWLIEKRLRGYEHIVEEPDLGLPKTPQTGEGPHITVIGGGLAGITAAERLANRGLQVTLIEKNPYLGGKIAAWTEDLGDGQQSAIEHGFHAYFNHYYNLMRWLKELDLTKNLAPISSYRVLTLENQSLDFRTDIRMAPGLNLLELARAGFYSLSAVMFSRAAGYLTEFVKYNPSKTFKKFDNDHFEGYAARAALPKNLLLVFRTFARSFFAEDDKISLAELMKSFHFFYLSHDHGLTYGYLAGDYESKMIAPLRNRLQEKGVRLLLGEAVTALDKNDHGYQVKTDRQEIACDALVLAADIRATKGIWASSPQLSHEMPALTQALKTMQAGQPYAVLRVWLKGRTDAEHPVFIATEREQLLDSITFLHQIDPLMEQWCQETPQGQGSVLELHSYAIPAGWDSEQKIQEVLLQELEHFLPDLKGAAVVKTHLQLRDDFTALHTGLYAARPKVETANSSLVLAGDWVKLDFPAMLMEAAHSSGLLAANRLLSHYGLQGYPITSVPPSGLLARKS